MNSTQQHAEGVCSLRRVMIATPSLTGQVDVSYAWSLAETIKMSLSKGVVVGTMFLPQNSVLQAARDELLAIAYHNGADDMVWIDGDISWRPEWFFKLLEYPVDIVGGTYRRKEPEETYSLKAKPWQLQVDDRGLMQVEALGTGFLRFSRKVIEWLWNNSEVYDCYGRERRWIFDIRPKRGVLVGEDVGVCNRLREAGFTINLDPAITCDHIGVVKFRGDFRTEAAKLYEPSTRSVASPTRPELKESA